MSVLMISCFATSTPTAFMTVAGRFRFTSQGLEFIPWLKFFTVEVEQLGAFFGFYGHEHFIGKREHIHNFAFTFGCDHTLVAFGKLLASLDVLFIFVDQATTQTAAHARDLVRRQ